MKKNVAKYLSWIIVFSIIIYTKVVIERVIGSFYLLTILIPLFAINTIPKPLFTNQLMKGYKWLIFAWIVVLINFLFGHGNSLGFSHLFILSYCLLLYLIGYRIADCIDYNGIGFISGAILFFIVLFYIIYFRNIDIIKFNINDSGLGIIKSKYHGNMSNNETLLFDLYPIFALIGNLSVVIFWNNKSKLITKIVLIFSFILIQFMILFSTFTAYIIYTILNLFLFYYLFNKYIKIRNKMHISKIAGIFLGICIAYILLSLFASGYFGSFRGRDRKISSLLNMASGSGITVNLIDEVTDDRSKLIFISIDNFINNPIIGVGAYTASGGILDYKAVASQHSFIFDTLAYYGCFGLLIIYIYIKLIIIPYKIFTNANSLKYIYDRRISLGYFCAILPLFMLSFLNPYLLNSSYDFLIMFIGGFLSRRLDIIKNDENKIIPYD